MGYIAYIIAGLMEFFGGSSKTFDQGFDHFLSTAANINHFLIWVALGIWAFIVLVCILFAIFGRLNVRLQGCVGLFAGVMMAALPLWQFVIYWLNTVMSNAYGPEGITHPVKFWVAGFFTWWLATG